MDYEKIRRRERGYSLIETMVAGVVLFVMIIVMVAMLRKSSDNISIDKHRRAARAIVERTLEDTKYQPINYNGLVTTNDSSTVVIDAKANNLLGKLITVVGDSVENTYTAIIMSYRPVTATVRWTEPGLGADSVRVTRWVTSVQ